MSRRAASVAVEDMAGSFMRRRIAVLTYHSLDDSGSVLSIPPRIFAQQMQMLADLDVKVVSLVEARHALLAQAFAEPLVAITFDDGFQNVATQALPILHRHGFPATIFLVTDYCGRENSWPSQPAHVQRRALLRWSEIKEMDAAGMAFGSHTLTHPDLTTVTNQVAEQEIISSKKIIEDAVGRSVESLAYPYGAYNDAVKKLAQLHYSLACTTRLDFVGIGSDWLALERLDVYYLRQPMLFRRIFSRELRVYLQLRRSIRDMRSRLSKRLNSLPGSNR